MKFIANGFVTELPDGWQDRSMLTLVNATDAGGFAPNIIVMRQSVAPETSIEDYVRQQRLITEAEIPDLEVLDERLAQVGGVPAFQRLQRFVAQGQTLQQAQTYVLGDREIFVLTCTATLEKFNDQIPYFRQVVENFRLFNPDTAAL